ncbi:MAG: hypothetical protein Kow0090_20630 [Myxococcota bacterium]
MAVLSVIAILLVACAPIAVTTTMMTMTAAIQAKMTTAVPDSAEERYKGICENQTQESGNYTATYV